MPRRPTALLPAHSVRDVLLHAPPDPLWLAFPLLTPGGITLLGGEPKTAGKTTLTFAALRAMHTGARFLARETMPGAVLYLTEEGHHTLGQVIRRSRLAWDTPIDFVLRHELGMMSWDELGRKLVALVSRGTYAVVIIDTWNEFTSMTESDENDAGAVRRAMYPLYQIRALDIAVLINHHFKKNTEGASVVHAMRGSSAIPAAVDLVAGLRLPEGDDDVRELEVRSRYDCANGRYWVQVRQGVAEIGSAGGEA